MRGLRGQHQTGREGGFTLIELIIVTAIIGVLAAIALPVYANLHTRTRVAKAEADVRTLASAITTYQANTGALPPSPSAMRTGLTTITIVGGFPTGPYLGKIPTPPVGGTPPWPDATTGYTYAAHTAPGGAPKAGVFVVCASGDGHFANAHSVASCP